MKRQVCHMGATIHVLLKGLGIPLLFKDIDSWETAPLYALGKKTFYSSIPYFVP